MPLRTTTIYTDVVRAGYNPAARTTTLYVDVIRSGYTPELQWAYGYIETLSERHRYSFSDTLTLTSSFTVQLNEAIIADFSHEFELTSTFEAILVPPIPLLSTFTPTDYFIVSKNQARIITLSFSSTLLLSQFYDYITYGDPYPTYNRSIVSTWELISSFEVDKSTGFNSLFSLTSTFQYDLLHNVQTINRTIESLFDPDSSFTIHRDAKALGLYLYEDFILNSTFSTILDRTLFITDTFIPETSFTKISDASLSLSHTLLFPDPYPLNNLFLPSWIVSKQTPYFTLISPTAILQLPQPEFLNRHNLINQLKTHHTLSGGIFTYIKRQLIQHLEFDFNINVVKMQEIATFLTDNETQQLFLEGWKSQLWVGYLVNDSFALTETTFSLTFEGVRLQ